MKDKYTRNVLLLLIVALVGMLVYRHVLFSADRGHVQALEVRGHQQQAPSSESQRTSHVAKRVIDGDTIILDNDEHVRLIGVDTPETNHPELPLQRFGKEATELTRRLVEAFKVRLEFGEERTDAYGRTLAYVFVGDVLVNKEIIRRGYGYAYTRFPHSRMAEFIEAEREARAKQYGLWNYSLTDGRIANLADRYERLSTEGKAKLEEAWDKLLEEYPAETAKGENP